MFILKEKKVTEPDKIKKEILVEGLSAELYRESSKWTSIFRRWWNSYTERPFMSFASILNIDKRPHVSIWTRTEQPWQQKVVERDYDAFFNAMRSIAEHYLEPHFDSFGITVYENNIQQCEYLFVLKEKREKEENK